MRTLTLCMAMVLGLFCTTAFAQPATVGEPTEAKPAAVDSKTVVTEVVEETTPAPAAAVVTEQAAPVCVNGTCPIQSRTIQPVRNLVVQPIARVMHCSAARMQQRVCCTQQRVQRFRQCRTRVFQRRCR